jgi:hypothetical protein
MGFGIDIMGDDDDEGGGGDMDLGFMADITDRGGGGDLGRIGGKLLLVLSPETFLPSLDMRTGEIGGGGGGREGPWRSELSNSF